MILSLYACYFKRLAAVCAVSFILRVCLLLILRIVLRIFVLTLILGVILRIIFLRHKNSPLFLVSIVWTHPAEIMQSFRKGKIFVLSLQKTHFFDTINLFKTHKKGANHMSGHSKWNNIAKRKGANDAKKAKIFTKIGREMATAAKEGGSSNPDNNSRLRDVIAKAKANNMPNDNIKRLLDKFSGASGAVEYEAINYEGYGPSGVAVIVETLTDNRNRTAADVRHLLDKYGAGMGATGCVGWQFDRKGVMVVENEDLDEDETMMLALDAGAEDFQADDETFQIYTDPADFGAVREALEAKGLKFLEAEIEMVPQNTITLEKTEDMAQMRKLLDMLEDNDDVQNVWHNWENEDEFEG